LNAWEIIIQQPVINVLIVMSSYLGDSFGLAIIALTVIVNLMMLPLTNKQIHATKSMQALQPKLLELQKKYGKDRQKLAQEQMRLYRESGVKPAGCMITMVIQFPVWIALYQSVMLCLAVAPEGLLNLSKYLYSWPVVFAALPLSRDFLGLDLAQPNMILAILVGGTMWLQQKMATPTASNPQQRAQSQMMMWMMPLLFAFLALSFPAGLSLYWVTSSVARIVLQYRATGWGGVTAKKVVEPVVKEKKGLAFTSRGEGVSTDDVGADIVDAGEPKGAYPLKPSKTRYQPGKDRGRHPKKK